MIEDLKKQISQYLNWLRDKTQLRQINKDWVEISTPYLDRDNDYILLYGKKHNGGFLLTDGGETLDGLEQSGCSLTSSKRQGLLKMTLNGFGVQQNQHALEVHASPENFALRKHNLVQAILSVNDLFYLASPFVESLFHEDVVSWLELSNVRFTPNAKFTGKSGYDHLFDFVIPKSAEQPERIVRAINRPDKNAAQAMSFAWLDTREVRTPESKAYAILNDSERTVVSDVIEALRIYQVTPVLWSERQAVTSELVA